MHELATEENRPSRRSAASGRLRTGADMDVPAAARELPAAPPGRPGDGGAAIAVVVPIRTGRGQNDREHWAAKARRVKQEREGTHWALLPHRRPSLPCTVMLTRVAPGNGLDGDNLQGSLKACRDGVADWLRVDDRDARVTWTYGQRRGKRGAYSVEVAFP